MRQILWPQLPKLQIIVGAVYETRHGRTVRIISENPYMPQGFVYRGEVCDLPGEFMFFNADGYFSLRSSDTLGNEWDLVGLVSAPF